MRLFVCTWLSPDNQAFFGRHIGDLVLSSRGMLRAIPRDSAHITHAFLGHVSDRAIDHVMKSVHEAASRHIPFTIRLGPPSILYARTDARLVHAPIVQGADLVATLGTNIVTALQQHLPDLEVSGTPSPHVTLARFRKHTHRRSSRAIADAMARSELSSSERSDGIAEVQVVSSELTAEAPRYLTLFRVPLDQQRPRLDG